MIFLNIIESSGQKYGLTSRGLSSAVATLILMAVQALPAHEISGFDWADAITNSRNNNLVLILHLNPADFAGSRLLSPRAALIVCYSCYGKLLALNSRATSTFIT